MRGGARSSQRMANLKADPGYDSWYPLPRLFCYVIVNATLSINMHYVIDKYGTYANGQADRLENVVITAVIIHRAVSTPTPSINAM